MAITNKDIEKMAEVFATKTEFRQFKDEISSKVSNLEVGQMKLQSSYENLEAGQMKLQSNYEMLLRGQDKLLKYFEDSKIEQKVAYYQHKEHDEKLTEHEKRIVSLEAKV